MPVSSYRSTLGFHLDKSPTFLTAAVAAAATSIPINGTSVPALSTITFIDGPLTESRAVTAGGGTSTLTVAALTNAHPANCIVVWQLTASLGPADYIPVYTLQETPVVQQLDDKGFRGSAVDVYGSVDGPRWGSLSLGGDVFPDTIPYLIAGVTGATDFSAGTPNSHAFSVLNSGSQQSTALGLWNFNGIDWRLSAGAHIDQLQLSIDPNNLFTWTASATAYLSGPMAAVTPSFGALPPSAAWQLQANIAGANVRFVKKCDVTIKRQSAPIITAQNIQDPYAIWQQFQSVEGTMTIIVEDNGQLNNYLNNTQPALLLTWTAAGANPNQVIVQLTKCNYKTYSNTQISTSGYVEAVIGFKGLANTTDATTAGTGSAVGKFTVKNAKPTGTYL